MAVGRGAALLLLAALPACALPDGSRGLPRGLPAPPDAALPLREKARLLEEDLGRLHLLPWGTLAYSVRLPEDPGGVPGVAYVADQGAWGGVLLAAEAERFAATGDPEALERVRALLGGLTALTAVTGERGFYARFACPRGFVPREPHPRRWRDGAPGWEGWRWRGDVSKDQAAGIVCGLSAVGDLVPDPPCRERAARLLGDLADRLLGRGGIWEDGDGRPTTYGDIRPRVYGVPVGVNAAIALGLADAASRATGEPRHRRMLEALVEGGACEALRYPTLRVFGKEGWSNVNMDAMALASILRRPPREGDAAAAHLRSAAEESMRRILALHRGEGNAFWIAVAAPAGEAAGATARDLEDAQWQLGRYPLDRATRRIDHSGRTDLPRAWWNTKSGKPQFAAPLPVDLQGAGSFVWKSNPYEILQEEGGDGRTVYAGTDFLAAYWPLRRLGVLRPEE